MEEEKVDYDLNEMADAISKPIPREYHVRRFKQCVENISTQVATLRYWVAALNDERKYFESDE